MSASEYSDDARRIESDYVDPDSTSREDIESDLRDADFNNPEDIGEWVLSSEDVGVDAASAHQDGVTTREEVADAVRDADTVGYSDARKDALTDAVSREVGAPSRDDLRRAQLQTITSADEVTPEGTTTSVSVLRDRNGDAVATIGGSSKAGAQVAEDLGVRRYSSPKEFTDSMTAKPAPDGRKALLYAGGEPVGEVDL